MKRKDSYYGNDNVYDGYRQLGSRYSSGAGRSGRHNKCSRRRQVLLPAADATFTEGEGVGRIMKKSQPLMTKKPV